MTKLNKLIKKFLSYPPEIRFEDVKNLLDAFGYKEIRSTGSHHIFRNDQGIMITVPIKSGQKVKRVYLKQIVILLNLENRENDENQD